MFIDETEENINLLRKPLIEHPKLHSSLESLDYEIVENEFCKQDWRSRSKYDIFHYTICKWVLACMVGLFTGLVALAINIAVENIAGIRFLFTVSFLVSDRIAWAFLVYATTNVTLVLLSALLCIYVAPTAAGSGVPEVKAYLNGVNCSNTLTASNLIVKIIGSTGAVASGLICGKAGPLIHMGACIAHILGQPGLTHRILGFESVDLLDNDKHRRDLVTCGAAAGLAAAFRAPVGGVLFALEEASSWWRSSLLWRSFFTTAVVAVVLRAGIGWCKSEKCGSYGSGGLILFDVSATIPFYGLLEIIPVTLMGIIGGVMGSLYNHLNAHFFLFNTRWQSKKGLFAKLLHAFLVVFITSVCSFFLPWLVTCKKCPENLGDACPTSGRIGNFKQFNCPDNHYNDLAGLIFNTSEDAIRNLFSIGTPYEYSYSSLFIFAAASYTLALMTYGILVPSGLFVPAILCGATYGRIVGMFMVSIFGQRLDESMYAVIGAASFLGGSLRMTVCLCVILLELTNNLVMLPLLMFVLLISKVCGDFFNDAIFRLHVDIKGFPFMNTAPAPFLSQLTARDAVQNPTIKFNRIENVGNILQVLNSCNHNGFPVIDTSNGRPLFMGLVLRSHIKTLLTTGKLESVKNIFPQEHHQQQVLLEDDMNELALSLEDLNRTIDLSSIVNQSPYTVLENMSLAKAYILFRQLGLRHLCVISTKLEDAPIIGILTRHDFMADYLFKQHPHLRQRFRGKSKFYVNIANGIL